MEHVSILAGRPFSDHPQCTHPMLATLARLVNDACTTGGRDRLLPYAAALARTPPADAVASARLVLAVGTAASAAPGTPRRLQRHVRAARRRLHWVTAAGPAGYWPAGWTSRTGAAVAAAGWKPPSARSLRCPRPAGTARCTSCSASPWPACSTALPPRVWPGEARTEVARNSWPRARPGMFSRRSPTRGGYRAQHAASLARDVSSQ